KRIKFGALCVGAVGVLCLLGVLRYQYSTIIDLRADNKEQAQALSQKEKEITRLKDEAAENQRIMLELSKAEAEARSESDEVIKSIPHEVKAAALTMLLLLAMLLSSCGNNPRANSCPTMPSATLLI
ncbi:DUF2570 domain-containing protein, partial [Aggregatibacter aphrophilus]|uniref:DUF2570 family protein n=1 Tax=Aggregatibacter aphrophilus TaxID=732 RepID=UPI0009F1BED7